MVRDVIREASLAVGGGLFDVSPRTVSGSGRFSPLV